MALGAEGRDVVRLVVRMGLRLVAIGVALGLLASLALGRVHVGRSFGGCLPTTHGLSRVFPALAYYDRAAVVLGSSAPRRERGSTRCAAISVSHSPGEGDNEG